MITSAPMPDHSRLIRRLELSHVSAPVIDDMRAILASRYTKAITEVEMTKEVAQCIAYYASDLMHLVPKDLLTYELYLQVAKSSNYATLKYIPLEHQDLALTLEAIKDSSNHNVRLIQLKLLGDLDSFAEIVKTIDRHNADPKRFSPLIMALHNHDIHYEIKDILNHLDTLNTLLAGSEKGLFLGKKAVLNAKFTDPLQDYINNIEALTEIGSDTIDKLNILMEHLLRVSPTMIHEGTLERLAQLQVDKPARRESKHDWSSQGLDL